MPKLKFKTKPFKHQRKALSLSKGRTAFAYLMEQGTGKSWVLIYDAAQLWLDGLIDFLLLIAPKGVAPGWVRKQLPDHMPDAVPYVAAVWRTPKSMSKARTREVRRVLEDTSGALRVIVMNTEAFGANEDAIDFAIEALDLAESAMIAVDESHRIKNHAAHSTKRIVNLRLRSSYRRILTGTIADKPFDVFPQFQFLDPAILEVDSIVAFRAEYAEMEDATSSGIMRHITRRIPKVWKGRYVDAITGRPTERATDPDGVPNQRLMEPAYIPPIVRKDEDGRPMYKNLDKLHALIAPHSFRVLKRDCLDIPEKTYNRYYTELSDRQQAMYNEARDNFRVEFEEGRTTTFTRLTVYLRLQQIICGYLPLGEGSDEIVELFSDWKENPRICSTLEFIDDTSAPMIVWCRFREDIRRICEALRESYGDRQVVEFHGGISDRDRDENVARFEGERVTMGRGGIVLKREEVPAKDRARFIVAQQRAGGLGQTWIAAQECFFYSNLFSLIDRLQSEDRPHRIGQRNVVRNTDMEAEDTIDSIIIDALVGKKEVADVINGDRSSAWLG